MMKLTKKYTALLFVVTIIFFFVRCLNAKTFANGVNGEVTIEIFPPKRIVSLSPNLTEILFALGLDDEIVGVTKECNFPPAALKKEKVSSYMSTNKELLVSLKPDVVFISTGGNLKTQALELKKLGLAVYAVDTNNIADIVKAIKDIGAVTYREEEAKKLAGTIEKEVKRVKRLVKSVERKTVFCVVGLDPIVGAGPDTFIGDVIDICGGENIIAGGGIGYPVINIEELYVKEPDVILLSSMGSEVVKNEESPMIKKFSKLKAAKKGSIFIVDADILCRPSYRITDALNDIVKKIHPEIFLKDEKE